MKAFDNLTSIKRENAIKVGTSVPKDAAALSWFSGQEVTPSNNVSVLDLSSLIPENRVDNEAKTVLAYADEMGVLRDFENNSVFKTNDLTISNKMLSRPNRSERVNPNNINPNDFIHYFYVSRFFIAAPFGYSLITLHDFVEPDKFLSLSIKVIDENGFEYIDPNSGRKKYRILLDPYIVEENSARTEIPYRVVVLLDSEYKTGLQLIYDKIEINENGDFSNQELRYSEKINPVKYFDQVPEEAFPIDYNYKDKRKFSVKKYSQKNAELISDIRYANGYQVFSPSKAIEDNRNFEVFNWRLIGRSNISVNLDEANYGAEFDENGSPIQKTVKTAVLYSSSSQKVMSTVNPYIFYRLEVSPFNFSKYRFYNPLVNAADIEKSIAAYWLVDIDTVRDLTEFDILAWSPSSLITNSQAAKIQMFLDNNGTILLDLSSASANARQLSELLEVNRSRAQATSVSTNYDSTLLKRETSGGWSLTQDIFENVAFGIYGSSKILKSNTNKSFAFFENSSPNQIVSMSSPTFSGQKDLAVWLSRPSQGSMIKKHNIIATTFPLMEYCNSIYSVSNPDVKISENAGESYFNIAQTNVYSSVTEGPLKFLYNIISYGLYSKAHSNRNIDVRSSLFNYVTEWDSSWVMDKDALLEDEKEEFFQVALDSNDNEVYARQIIPQAISVVNYYKENLAKNMPEALAQRLSALDYSNIDFYIEVTNPDVDITNASRVEALDEDVASSYSLFKVRDPNATCRAFTVIQSPRLLPNPDAGYYAVIEKPTASSSLRSLRGLFDTVNYLKSYNFDLDSGYYYFQARDKSFNLKSALTVSATATVSGNYYKIEFRDEVVGRRPKDPKTPSPSASIPPPSSPTVTPPTPGQVPTGPLNCLNYKSAIDEGFLRANRTAEPANVYLYTNDIELGNSTKTWRQGDSGDYVRYIQFSVVNDGFNIAVDGQYGPRTAEAVRGFQTKHSQRYIDGTVDSETKSYFAFKVWKRMTSAQFTQAVNACNTNPATAPHARNIIAYMSAARNSGEAARIGSLNYNKITFTGFAGPTLATDVIYFELPSNIEKVKEIKIKAGTFNNFKVTHYGYSSSFNQDIFSTRFFTQDIALNSSNEIVINLPNLPRLSCRYFWVRVEGRSLGPRYGFGEGFSIASVVASGESSQVPSPTPTPPVSDPSTPVPPPSDEFEDVIESLPFPVSENFNVSVQVVFNEEISNINPAAPVILNYDTSGLARKSSYSISEISYTSSYTGSRTFSNPQVTFTTTNYSPEPYVTINLSSVSSISINSVSISSIKDEDNQDVQLDAIDAAISGSTITFTTFGTSYFNDTEVQVISNQLDDYYLVNDNNVLINYAKDSISVSDGVLRFCDEDKKPIGLVKASEIRSLEINGNEEVDYKYGYLYLKNNLITEEGFIYGFYDNLQKEFIGRTISYVSLISRGIDNVYIAVCAIDADGNSLNTQDYIGPTPSATFKPVNIPIKILAPVYSVSYKNSAYIKVGNMQNDLAKHTAWPLPVSSGSFIKKITRPAITSLTGAAGVAPTITRDYYALYNTSNLPQVNWSAIYGFGNYDIKSETPLILSDRAIKTRTTPILNWNHPSNYSSSIVGVTVPQISVSKRETMDSQWEQIPLSSIRSIDCSTGIIEFNSSIIYSDPNLTKVDYTISLLDSLIYHIDGYPVPLNPILNKEEILYGKPLYIYILPVEVYTSRLESDTEYFTKVEDYISGSSVNFSYDSSIFNPNSILYNPLALPIAIIYSVNNPKNTSPSLIDLRSRGGGVINGLNRSEIESISEDIISNWDIYSPNRDSYAKGGYVIIRLPEEVRNNFLDPAEVYEIIRNNLTAGVVFDLQNMDGETWSVN
jgi:hypothetical protein